MRKPRPALIVDPDPNFLETLASDPASKPNPAFLTSSGKEAQLKLADLTQPLAGVFVNPKTARPSGFSVIRFAHQYRPTMPIFIIYDDSPGVSDEDLQRLPVQQVIPKPLSYSQLMSFVSAPELFFDPKAAIEANKSADKTGVELTTEDTGFLPIRADDFVAGTKSFFDLYVRLGPGKYVKILQAGDDFSPDRLNNYLKKGVTHFFLKKEAQEKYLGYCDHLVNAALKSTKVRIEAKVALTLNHGEETLSFLKNQGLSDTNLQYASSYVTNVKSLVDQLAPEKNDLLKGFLADLAAYEHGVGTSMIAAMLCKPLEIGADHAVQIIGMASLLHDVGLYRMDAAIRTEDESKMTPDQRGVYRTHPAIGSQMLRGIRGVDPAVIQAVAQHHERRNKRGFPARVGVGLINRVAEIVGISDEFSRLIDKSKTTPSLNILQEMELNVFDGFSAPVIEAFRSIFFRHR